MSLLKKLGIIVPLTIASIWSFGQKDTTYILNKENTQKIIDIEYKGDSIIFEKQYGFNKKGYFLTLERSSSLEDGKIICINEVSYKYNSKPLRVDSYTKRKLGTSFKGRIQTDKFEKSSKLIFYEYDDEKRLSQVKTMTTKNGGKDPKTKVEYYIYKKDQEMRWEDNNNNGEFDNKDKMFLKIKGKWVEITPESNE